jgi:hypothetical protein
MDSNGRPLKNSFTTKININNNNIEGVKDVILNNVPITQTIDEFKNQDESILLRLQILENYKTLSELQTNTMSGRILYLEQQNLRLKQIIYNLVNIAY